ncbi:MAG: HD domain-containing protein [Pseudobutyrivibrio sp.]|nr:HD domain-containing protein [Pseudobutyrivibrio sp.]
MEFFYLCKSQLCCLSILLYITLSYISQSKRLRSISDKYKLSIQFNALITFTQMALILEIIKLSIVQDVTVVPVVINHIIHYLLYGTYVACSMIYFTYWAFSAESKKFWNKGAIICSIPGVLALIVGIFEIPSIRYIRGNAIYYSLGVPVYIMIGAVYFYFMLSAIAFYKNRVHFQKNELVGLVVSMVSAAAIMIMQMMYPETLMAGGAITIATIGVYLGVENPSVKEVELYHEEMLLGFSSLLDRKDGGTGGHIKRTSIYAELIATELGKMDKYSKKIGIDYLTDLKQAAPMHDIGKISIPDSILQKPGKLTPEEYEVMKTHSAEGASIIIQSFEHIEEHGENSMAYKVALCHHEKWDGTGYPQGLAGDKIPLCARIMAVADVFDAVSSSRCYREAMPLNKCFAIIDNGRAKDFDPEVVDAFFAIKDQIIMVYDSLKEA